MRYNAIESNSGLLICQCRLVIGMEVEQTHDTAQVDDRIRKE